MSALALPRPDNLRGAPGVLIESDVFNICERIKELSPNLYVYALDPPVHFAGRTYTFAVGEMCADGVERLVKRFEALDARIIQELEYMLGVPFEKRFAEAERLEAKVEAEHREKEFEKLYTNMGEPMRRQLEHDGFIAHRGVSFPKRGVTGGRGSQRRATS